MSDKVKPTVVVIGTGAANMRALAPDAGPAAITDPIAAAADLAGKRGRAWKCDLAEARRIARIRPEDDAALVHWVIEAPFAHPCWHSYSLVLVHLRPSNLGESRLFLPCASHELWLWALDATKDRRPLIASGLGEGVWLQPKNFAAQFVELSDNDALARIERAVQDICDGVLSPDTDFQRDWIARFGDNMVKRR